MQYDTGGGEEMTKGYTHTHFCVDVQWYAGALLSVFVAG